MTGKRYQNGIFSKLVEQIEFYISAVHNIVISHQFRKIRKKSRICVIFWPFDLEGESYAPQGVVSSANLYSMLSTTIFSLTWFLYSLIKQSMIQMWQLLRRNHERTEIVWTVRKRLARTRKYLDRHTVVYTVHCLKNCIQKLKTLNYENVLLSLTYVLLFEFFMHMKIKNMCIFWVLV